MTRRAPWPCAAAPALAPSAAAGCSFADPTFGAIFRTRPADAFLGEATPWLSP